MKFKEGDRVLYGIGGLCEESGTVVEQDGSIYNKIGYIWVRWDSDGKVLNTSEDSLELEKYDPIDMNEQEAVMLLLSLGYTVSKNKP
jgi:hypothetical protein